jgi:hypothetical protein
MKMLAKYVISTIAMLLCTATGAFLLYKTGHIAGQDAICYAGLIAGQIVFFPLGRKRGIQMLAPSIVAGIITALPAFLFSLMVRMPSDDQVVFLAQLLPAYGALLGCCLGIIAGMRSDKSSKPTLLHDTD